MDFRQIKEASRALALLDDAQRNDILFRIADRIESSQEQLLAANALDLQTLELPLKGAGGSPLYDRLLLTPERLRGIASDMRHVAALPSPLGIITKERTLANGLYLRRISVPFGVIGVIFEARPNVCFDVFSLCFKSGNACILKGSRNAQHSNEAIVALIHEVLRETDPPQPSLKGRESSLSQKVKGQRSMVNDSMVNGQWSMVKALTLLPPTHEATAELLGAVGYVDLVIPRGGRKLIDFVRDNARVPVIETGAGVVHAYFDKDGDLEKGQRIIKNAKMRRVSVCNALDCLLVHRDRAADIPALLAPMEGRVEVITDEAAMGTEWMDYKLSLKVVDSLDEALAHIARYGSGHSECIITENEQTARRFQLMVDAACVYVNAPTSFTDGAQFGLGAEIGISTQKLGPRGPMALEEMTTYKWLINGNGQTRG
ncbi:MAG: gamma-glutamyl-phosphate reductase [Bacteroidaceae bacterium]|nr:gamma-glutamyl-phosphate reductase [Bacteroidaceae bacterium]